VTRGLQSELSRDRSEKGRKGFRGGKVSWVRKRRRPSAEGFPWGGGTLRLDREGKRPSASMEREGSLVLKGLAKKDLSRGKCGGNLGQKEDDPVRGERSALRAAVLHRLASPGHLPWRKSEWNDFDGNGGVNLRGGSGLGKGS